jgi:hypothetical protein
MSGDGDVTSEAGGTLHLIGFRVDPNLPDPDFYVLTTGLNGDVPLLHEGQIILFQQPGAAQDALRLAFPDQADRADRSDQAGERRPPADLAVVVDLAEVFYLLTSQTRDESGAILQAVNLLLDFLSATEVVVPPLYRADLHELADHLTFGKSFGELFDTASDRAGTVEAVQWALGAVMSRSMFVPKGEPQPARPRA